MFSLYQFKAFQNEIKVLNLNFDRSTFEGFFILTEFGKFGHIWLQN